MQQEDKLQAVRAGELADADLGEKAHDDHQETTPVILLSEGQAKRNQLTFRCWYSIFVIGLSAVMFGYDNGIIGGITALPGFVKKYQGLDKTTGLAVFSSHNQSLLFSVPLVGSILGAAVAYFGQKVLTRKWVLVVAYLASIPGVVLQLFAPTLGAFVAGRFWNAACSGVAQVVGPLYLGDMVPPTIRGAAVQAVQFANILSSVIATVILYRTDKISGPWSYHVPLIIQAAAPVFLTALTLFVSQSPLDLLQRGRDEALVQQTLRNLRGFTEAELQDEYRSMLESERQSKALTEGAKWTDIFAKRHIKRTVVSGALYSMNQVTGVILSTTYATVFLTQLNVGNPFQLSIIAACCQLAGQIIAPLVVDRVGRRPLGLFACVSLTAIDFIAGGLAFKSNSKGAALGIAILSFIFNTIWTSSFYCLSPLLPTEIPTPRLRNLTVSYTFCCAFTTAVITTYSVPQLTAADGANLGAKTYLVFGGCTAMITVFFYFFVPETAKRTYAEIDEMYEAKVPAWRWKSYETSPESKLATVEVTRGGAVGGAAH